jgi:glutathione S-transferase
VKLFYSPTSPYVRKVMACAITRGLDRRIELLPTNPHVSPPELLAVNPLSKVPCLVTDDGTALYDSPVICDYLDSLDGVPELFPQHGRARWRALRLQALADGLLDAAILRRQEQARPAEPARGAVLARQKAAVDRALEMLEKDPPHEAVDIGSISAACALGYLDLRFGNEPWRPACPQLAAWFAAFSDNPGIARTVPRDPA